MNIPIQEGGPLWRCQSCGSALSSAEAECAQCAAGIAAHRLPDEGPHRCPCCSAWFAMPGARREPPDAPWYRPSSTRLLCPHCGVALRDRMRTTQKPWAGLLLVAVTFALQRWAPPGWRESLWMGCMVVFGLYMFSRRERGVTDETRYAPDDR
ncbi:MAG: hypothetical protein JNK17_15575 [Hydrogenophaga sp.]|nr:hypothetical protein [Hydrogenophaga sp.]